MLQLPSFWDHRWHPTMPPPDTASTPTLSCTTAAPLCSLSRPIKTPVLREGRASAASVYAVVSPSTVLPERIQIPALCPILHTWAHLPSQLSLSFISGRFCSSFGNLKFMLPEQAKGLGPTSPTSLWRDMLQQVPVAGPQRKSCPVTAAVPPVWFESVTNLT